MDRFLEFVFNHYIYSLALLVVSYLLIQDLFDAVFKKYSAITPLMAVTKMNEVNTVVVDVREVDEFSKGHIESAINSPLSKLPEQLSSLEAHKRKPILIACDSGTRSNSAGKILAKAGFEQIFVITGGMTAWTEDYKLPIKSNSKNKSRA
ncbi:MAG: rhodanese-like domain-containing protein [Methylococcaceae bacterium]|nr:rhodanese-like domain-containing protein [Methylococcaceae bacterium]